MPDFYIGLMSGTSLDGIDACLIDFTDNQYRFVDFYYHPFPSALKNSLKALSNPLQPIMLSDLGTIDHSLGQLFADVSLNLLIKASISPTDITAIGSHGVTVHHAPSSQHPFSCQIGDPNIIAQQTGITTVADFRRRDIAAGGQGAPMVPAFHQYFFSKKFNNLCVLNIGGMANITVLNDRQLLGFDTGPGNTLMDYWTFKHQQQHYDKNGEWAASGKTNQVLLNTLKSDAYFQQAPPKSTGKEYFSPTWLQTTLPVHMSATDVQATLCQLTADSISNAIRQFAPATERTIVCGGGSHNQHLMTLLQHNLEHPVESTAAYGIDPDHVEAAAFAWLARQTINGRPGNLPEATGAEMPVILGGIYPGNNQLN